MINGMLKARAVVVGLFLCLMMVSIIGASRLSLDPNNRVFFGEGHAHFRALVDLEAQFGSNTSILFLITSEKTLDQNFELAEAIRWISRSAWSIAEVVSVASIATHPHVTAEGDDLLVENLLDYICPPSDGWCLEARTSELAKPHLVNRFVGREAKSFAVVADVDLSSPTADAVTRIDREAAALKAEFQERYPDLRIFITGGVPMMQAFFDAARSDSERLMLIAVVVLSIGLYVFLGGWVPTLLMILLGVSSVVVSMGLAGWLGLVINTATATVPLIVFTLVIAAAMHVFLHIVREERLDSSDDVRRAVRTGVAANWRPVLLTAATTSAGLLSMIFVSAPPLRELGILAAVGVTCGGILSLTVIPCLFTYLSRLKVSDYLRRLQELMNQYARWLENQRPRMVWMGVAFLVALLGLARLSVDEDFVRYFSSESSFRQDTESITERLAGPYHIDLVYDAGESAGVYGERSIDELGRLKRHLASLSGVANVTSLLDVLQELSLVMSGSSDLVGTTPEELAQYFLSYELSLSAGQSTRSLVDSDHRRARISVLLADVSMRELRTIAESTNGWALENGLDARLTVTGEGIPTAYLSSESIKEMALGIAASIFLSALLVGFYFRNLRVCFVIFAATMVPILAGFGVWGWLGSDIGMAATLVVATTIGVVVDDTIHLTYRYVDSSRTLDLTRWGAIAYSVHKTGTAISVTSIAIIAGLLVLIGSEFQMNSTFGICSSMVIALALVYNLTIAPILLKHLE